MSGRDPESLKELCKQLARKLGANPSRMLLQMTLKHSGLLRRAEPAAAAATAAAAAAAARPAAAAAVEEARPAASAAAVEEARPAASAAAAARGPQPISVWEPREEGGEVVFVRPAPSRLGDGFSAHRSFARRKTARRICFLGESVALGFLYAPHLTPAQVLAHQLNAVAGAGAYEVIDLSKSSESMLPLVGTMEGALQLEPDAFVIFAGNNWNFQETDVSPHVPVASFRARYARALRGGGLAEARELGRQLLDEKARVALGQVAALAARRATPVVVIVPEVNLADWETRQPVVWRRGADTARWYALLDQARQALDRGALDRGALDEALELSSEMWELDGGTSPTPHRLQALAYRALGRPDDAARAARAEVDADQLPTMGHLHCPQATTRVQDALRRAGEVHGFAVVDLPEVFAAHAGSPLPGRRYFLDYCHLTAEGMHVAMAATASAVLRLGGVAERPWPALLAEVPAAAVAPEIEALARFGAAVHTAHRLQAVSDKQAILEHWCEQALEASPGIADAMFELIEVRCSPCPTLLSDAARRNAASRHPLMFQHGLEWPNVDAELIEAIVAALERRGVPARARVTRLLIERFAVDDPRRAPVDLASGQHRWDLYAASFAEALNLGDARHRTSHRAIEPETALCLIATGEHDLALSIHVRVPEVGGAGAGEPAAAAVEAGRFGEPAPRARVHVNGALVHAFEVGPAWSAERARIPASALRAGINRLTLSWPLPAADGEAALRGAIERLERGLPADVHPVFGEVYSLIARRWTEADDAQALARTADPAA